MISAPLSSAPPVPRSFVHVIAPGDDLGELSGFTAWLEKAEVDAALMVVTNDSAESAEWSAALCSLCDESGLELIVYDPHDERVLFLVHHYNLPTETAHSINPLIFYELCSGRD